MSKLAALTKARSARAQSVDSKNFKSLEILEKLKGQSTSPKPDGQRVILQRKAGLTKLSRDHKWHLIAQPQETQKVIQVKDRPSQSHSSISPKIDYEIPIDKENSLQYPDNSVSVFFFERKRSRSESSILHHISDNRNKRRRYSNVLFHPLTNHEINIESAKKVRENFNEASPDDKILVAQRNAFEDNLKGLKISDAPKQNVEKEKSFPKKTKAFKKVDISKEISTNSLYSKPHKSFVVIGHVDAGKSTLMGRLLYDLKVVDAKTVNKLVREAEKSGKGSFALAWIMDQTTEERSRGVTVDICATDFDTSSTRFTAIDAPGHKDFVPQMIGGVTQADVALLVVDAINGEFEAGFKMDGQTKEHTLLVKNLGIEKLCVAVNKLDKEGWSNERFTEIESQLTAYLSSEEVGFSQENITFIPISGLTGQNVAKRESIKEFDWYKGPTLIKYLEKVEISNESVPIDLGNKVSSEDFTLSVNDVFEISNSEFGVKGKVLSGYIQPGETVVISPSNDYLQVQSLKMKDNFVDVAISGENVTISFKLQQLTNKSIDELNIGDLILKSDSPVASVRSFTSRIRLFNMNKPLLVGTPFLLFRNNSYVPARITKIIDIEGDLKKKKKKHLVSKNTAIVEIEVQGDRPLPLAKFSDSKLLGRVVIRREGATVGAGTVLELL